MSNVTALQAAPEELNAIQDSRMSSVAIFGNDRNMEKVMSLAKLMSTSKVTVPKHLQGSEGDCMAVIFQALNWGMNPFAVAQKTHLVNGTLGYEAQLVNAVIQQSGAIHGRLHYEYKGEGNALECRVGAVIAGEQEITFGEWLKSSDVTTKNSPLWKTNPRQQLGYLQVKNWSRAFCPGAILGVYTPDELELIPEKEINPRPARQTGTQAAEAAKQEYQQAHSADSAARTQLIADLETVAEQYGVEAYAEQWSKLTKEQRKVVGADEHERLKKIAASIATDPAEMVDEETGEVTGGAGNE